MEFKNEILKTSFTIPDRPTVRQQMAYFSETARSVDRQHVERLWMAAQSLISNWKSEIMPDMKADLDATDNPKVTDVIIWASLQVKNHINSLDETPKN